MLTKEQLQDARNRAVFFIGTSSKLDDCQALEHILAALDAYEHLAALPAYWKKVTPPNNWASMRTFIADVEKALTQPRKDS